MTYRELNVQRILVRIAVANPLRHSGHNLALSLSLFQGNGGVSVILSWHALGRRHVKLARQGLENTSQLNGALGKAVVEIPLAQRRKLHVLGHGNKTVDGNLIGTSNTAAGDAPRDGNIIVNLVRGRPHADGPGTSLGVNDKDDGRVFEAAAGNGAGAGLRENGCFVLVPDLGGSFECQAVELKADVQVLGVAGAELGGRRGECNWRDGQEGLGGLHGESESGC